MVAVKRSLRRVAIVAFVASTAATSAWPQASTAIVDPTGNTKIQPFEPTGAPQTSATSSEVTTVSIQKSLGPYGDPGGVRAYLLKKGIDYNFTYIADLLGNPTGGFKRGANYEGRLDAEINADLEKVAGLKGLTFHSTIYQINGRGLSTNNLMDLFTVSGIEAFADTKLYEAWFEQKLFDDKLGVKVGQIAIDADYLVSQTASVFVNSTYGFPAGFAVNLPSGGSSYAYAALGVRLKYQPSDKFWIMSTIYDGDPAHTSLDGVPNFQTGLRDRGGIAFRLKDPPLWITEAAVIYNNDKENKASLPGTIHVGYLHHFDRFQAFNVPPDSTTTYRGNNGAYLMIDQSIYREKDKDDGASVFARVMGSPADRNLFDFYFDAGIAYQGLLPGRDQDTVGITGAYGHISPSVTRQDILGASAPLIRTYQSLIEATYQYVVVNGFTLQPDFQYIIHPGANGVADPRDGRPLRNATVYGLRATVVY